MTAALVVAGVLATTWAWRATAVLAQAGTVTGRVVCLVCYTRDKKNVGHDHDQGFACDRACIKWEGNPAALVTADGKVYQLAGGIVANNNEKVSQHLAETVTATGRVFERNGMTVLETSDVAPAAGK